MRTLCRNLAIVLAAIVFLAASALAVGMWQFNRSPFDLAKLQRLQQGMTQAQVREILGKPRRVDGAGWLYARPMAWPEVHVCFDADGRLTSYEYDF